MVTFLGAASFFFGAAAAAFFFGAALVVFLAGLVTFFGAAAFLVAAFFGAAAVAFLVVAFLATFPAAADEAGFSFLANLTGPDGPFGCKKSPVSTPFLKAVLNKESKLAVLMSLFD